MASEALFVPRAVKYACWFFGAHAFLSTWWLFFMFISLLDLNMVLWEYIFSIGQGFARPWSVEMWIIFSRKTVFAGGIWTRALFWWFFHGWWLGWTSFFEGGGQKCATFLPFPIIWSWRMISPLSDCSVRNCHGGWHDWLMNMLSHLRRCHDGWLMSLLG